MKSPLLLLNRTRNIIACHEGDVNGPAPMTLRNAGGTNRLVGRTILKWSHLGTYGMGGPGFAGFHLSETQAYPQEWLTLAFWGAFNWLLLDGRWASAHPQYYKDHRPWIGWAIPIAEQWDEFTPIITDARIAEARIEQHESLICLERGGALKGQQETQRHLLEVPRDLTRLSRYPGTNKYRVWSPRESCLDAWIISQSGILYC